MKMRSRERLEIAGEEGPTWVLVERPETKLVPAGVQEPASGAVRPVEEHLGVNAGPLAERAEMINAVAERCAGIDVARRQLNVCVLTGAAAEEPAKELRQFGTHPAELETLRLWLKERGCTHVAMESTGSYWKPVFEALEEDMTVLLANAEDIRGRRGHKTDWLDCEWIAHLLRHGLIQPSFIPPRAVRDLRDLTRRRRQLIADAASERNRVQKVLDEANVAIGRVLGDVFGVSGQLMLEKLLDGETDVRVISGLAQRSAKRKIPELLKVLEGHRMRDHHRRLIRLSVEHLGFLETQIAAIDGAIAALLDESGLRKANDLLMSLPGIQETAAAAILAETGSDMSVFPTPGHLSSWAGVAPGNNVSGGKAKPAAVSRGNRWMRTAMVECAWGAAKAKDSPVKEQFERLSVKGRKKALVAAAHSMVVLIHRILTTGEPWQPGNLKALDERKRQRLIRHYIRRLGKLGVAVCSVRPAPERTYRKSSGTRIEPRNTKSVESNPKPALPKIGLLRGNHPPSA